jgi:hypothetical protein
MFRSMKWFRNASSASRKPVRRPWLQIETLEDRQLLSNTAFSNLGGVPVQFTLRDDGHLLQTSSGVTTDIGAGVQGLYQGHDSTGHQLAFEQVNNYLYEFTPDHGWLAMGSASLVREAPDGSIWFLGANPIDGLGNHAIYRVTNGQVSQIPCDGGVLLEVAYGRVSMIEIVGGTLGRIPDRLGLLLVRRKK